MNCPCFKCCAERDKTHRRLWSEMETARFIVCETCGNKRCPHATDHDLPCTDSNEPGQKGSRYE